jgi:hypothetical protein
MGNSFGKNQPENASDDSMDVDHQPCHKTVGNGMHKLTAAQRKDVVCREQSSELLEDGSRRNSRGTCEKMCEMCGECIDLGRTLSGDAALSSESRRIKALSGACRDGDSVLKRWEQMCRLHLIPHFTSNALKMVLWLCIVNAIAKLTKNCCISTKTHRLVSIH